MNFSARVRCLILSVIGLSLGFVGCERNAEVEPGTVEPSASAIESKAASAPTAAEPAAASAPQSAEAIEPTTSHAEVSDAPAGKPRLLYETEHNISAVNAGFRHPSFVLVEETEEGGREREVWLIELGTAKKAGPYRSVYANERGLFRTRGFAQVTMKTPGRTKAVLDVASGEAYGVPEFEGLRQRYVLNPKGKAVWFVRTDDEGTIEYGSIERTAGGAEVTERSYKGKWAGFIRHYWYFRADEKALIVELIGRQSGCRLLELPLEGEPRCLVTTADTPDDRLIEFFSPTWMFRRDGFKSTEATMVNIDTGKEMSLAPKGCRPFIQAQLDEPLRIAYNCTRGGDELPKFGIWSPEKSWHFSDDEFPKLGFVSPRSRFEKTRFHPVGRAKDNSASYVLDLVDGRVIETPGSLLAIEDATGTALMKTEAKELVGFELRTRATVDLGEVKCDGDMGVKDKIDGQFLLICSAVDEKALEGETYQCGMDRMRKRRQNRRLKWAQVVDVPAKKRHLIEERPIGLARRNRVLVTMDAGCDHIVHLSDKLGVVALAD